jgi:site-specific recombinase XerD
MPASSRMRKPVSRGQSDREEQARGSSPTPPEATTDSHKRWTDERGPVTTSNASVATACAPATPAGAIHSLFRYAALRHPEHASVIERVLAIPPKRADRKLISFLDKAEVSALLEGPGCSTWTGRRDHALLLLAVQTGCAPPT